MGWQTEKRKAMLKENQSLHIPTGPVHPGQYATELRQHLNILLSLALAPNGLDLDQDELHALRGVSDLMLQLHLVGGTQEESLVTTQKEGLSQGEEEIEA